MTNHPPLDERTVTAYHEAAHAVAFVQYNLGFRSVTIRPRGRRLGGIRCDGDWPWVRSGDDHLSGRAAQRLKDYARAFYAASCAEERLTGCRDPVEADSDRMRARWCVVPLAEPHHVDALCAGLKSEAAALVSDRWAAVEAVATALRQRGRLTAAEVREVIREAAATARPPGERPAFTAKFIDRTPDDLGGAQLLGTGNKPGGEAQE